MTGQVYSMCKNSPGIRHDLNFRGQIQSASVSIMSNIAEGFSRKTDKEFAQFLFIAKGSIAEVQSLLYVALDQDFIDKTGFTSAYDKADEIARILSGLITAIK